MEQARREKMRNRARATAGHPFILFFTMHCARAPWQARAPAGYL